MKWKLWTTLALLTALLSGCMGRTECDWVRPVHFSNQSTVDWLLANDRPLLEAVVTLNETQKEVCQ